MEEGKINEKDFYNAAQGALLSYDSKLWLIPGLFFGLLSWFANFILNQKLLYSLKNLIISFLGSIGLFILILLHNKAHLIHISIAKKINELEQKSGLNVFPLTSVDKNNFKLRINELEKISLNGNKILGAEFNCIQKTLAFFKVSSWVRNMMIFSFSIVLSFCLVCIFKVFF